jgi:hypothetical protein
MRKAARAYALTASWDAVFEGVYAHYPRNLPETDGSVAEAHKLRVNEN